jgi:ADP-ribosylation factor protein 1
VCRHYFKDNDALIFVIDCADRARLGDAKKALTQLLDEPQLLQSVVLVYGNKADLPNAMDALDLARFLDMDKIAGTGENQRGRRGGTGLLLTPCCSCYSCS